MKRIRQLLAGLLSASLIASLAPAALATTTNNGVQPPVEWTSPTSYDWYTAFETETERTAGIPVTKSYTFEVKANIAKLTVANEGVTELDIAVNGNRFNLNAFFDQGQGTKEFDLSSLVKYGTNTIDIQSLGTPKAVARIKVEAPAFTARIFHVNDIHAKINDLPKAAAYIKAAKDQGGNVYLANAGDNFSGNPVSDLNKGVPMIQVLNAMTTDVLGVGNHDFDHGPEHTQARREESHFPWVTANTEVVDQSATPIQPFEPYTIMTTDLGQKIAFIGLTETPPATGKKNIVGLQFNDPLTTAQKYVAEVRDQVNLVVLVSHQGLDKDTSMAADLTGVDLIISAHSHTLLTKPEVVNNIPIVQAGSDGRNMGDLVLRQAESVTLTGGAANGSHVVDVTKLSVTDAETKAVVDHWNDLMGPALNAKIGYTPIELDRDDRYMKDVSIGNLITDALRDYFGAEVGFWNNGGVRASIPAGDITMQQVYTVLPFANQVMLVEVTGQQLYDAIVGSFNYRNQVDLQTSGLHYTVFTKPDGSVDYVVATVNGEPLDLDRTYTASVSDYVYGGSRYGLSTAPVLDLASDTDALIVGQYVEKIGNLTYQATEGRIKVKSTPTPVPVSNLNFYNSSSLLAADETGALTALTNQAAVLVTAESTAYQYERSAASPKNFAKVDAGTPIPVAAMEQVGGGKVVATGALLVANGFRTGYQNAQWFTNLLDYLAGKQTGAVLVDEGHGQYYDNGRFSQIKEFLADRGWTMTFTGKNTQLTAAKLTGVKILMITTPGSVGAYTAEELTVLQNFVAGGGSVIIASQTDYNNNSNPTELNSIAAAIGTKIRFNSDEVRDNGSNDGANYSPVTNEFNATFPQLLKTR